MHPYPHRYHVQTAATSDSPVTVSATSLPTLDTAPPTEFGGPGDQWSPETLLVAAAADCFVLTFRAIARASKFDWESIACDAEGVLDRVDGVTRFTAIEIRARLMLPAGSDHDKASRLLEKAEKGCLITNSMTATTSLVTEIESSAAS